jgi:L-arabinose transport system substrate-binding protein
MSRRTPIAVIAAISTLALGSLAACTATPTSGPTDSKSIKLAFLPSFEDPYYVQEANGAQAEADKLGVKLVVQNSKGDSAAAVSNLQTLVTTGGVDGALMVVLDQSIGTQVVNIAKTAKVPLIAVDTPIEGLPFYGFEWAKIGTEVGDRAAKLLSAEKWDAAKTAAVNVELPGLDTCNDRTNAASKAFLDSTPNFPKANLLKVPYDGSENSALNAMATVKTAHPDIQHWVIWSCNDDGVVGPIQALTSAGAAASDIIGVGLGGNLACPTWDAGNTTAFRETNFTDPARTAALAVKALYENITKGTPIPKETKLDGVTVTPDNYKEKMTGYVNCK